MSANVGIFTDPWGTAVARSDARTAPPLSSASYFSLRFAWRACRRRWRLCLAIALGCALLGAGTHLFVAPAYSSSSDLYLSEPPAATPSEAMANDVAFLQTTAVASRAIHALHQHLSATGFLASYRGTSQSDAILSVTVGAPTPAEALARNRAIDTAFLSLRADEFRLQTHAAVAVLRSQISTLQGRIGALDTAITSSSAHSGGTAASSLANLTAQRNNDQSEVLQVQNNVQQDLVALASLTNGSGVLDPPALVKQSRYKAMFIDALSGLIAGLALAFGYVGLKGLLSDRPRTREEVAALLGAPVELSLGRQARRHNLKQQQLEDLLEHPSPSVLMIERRLRAQAEAVPDLRLGIVTIGADDLAAQAVVRLAVSFLSDGKQVVLADDITGHPLARLLPGPHAPGALCPVSIDGHVLQLFVGTDDPADMAQQPIPDSTDVVLALTDPDPAFGAKHLASWISQAVVMVGRERVSTARIAMTAELLQHEELPVRSAILLGVLPDDESLGVLRRRLSSLDPRRVGAMETASS